MHLRVQILPGLPRLSRPVQMLLPGWAELALPGAQENPGNERLRASDQRRTPSLLGANRFSVTSGSYRETGQRSGLGNSVCTYVGADCEPPTHHGLGFALLPGQLKTG